MKTKDKILTAVLLTGAAVAGIAVINRWVKEKAVSGGFLKEDDAAVFPFREGDVVYSKSGSGSPVLLLHDLNPVSSGKEWSTVIPALAETHTIFVPDLPGCGRSEKRNMIYTNYLYVVFLRDFIRSEIRQRTDVICEGASVPLVIMAAHMYPEWFGKLVFTAPEPLSEAVRMPGEYEKHLRTFLNLPVLGTLFYQIMFRRQSIAEHMAMRDFLQPYRLPERILEERSEASHLGASPKSLYSSLLCGYLGCDIRGALSGLKQRILLITGSADPSGAQYAENYCDLNRSITSITMENCKRYPQIEVPVTFAEEVSAFLS